MTQKIKSLAPLGATDECVIVPLRGTDWGGCAVSPGFVPLRGTHLGFDSLAALRATRAFGAGREGVIADMPRHVPTLGAQSPRLNCEGVIREIRCFIMAHRRNPHAGTARDHPTLTPVRRNFGCSIFFDF